MDLPGPLDKQVGPLPVAAWLAIGVVGVGAGLFITRRLRAPEPADDLTTEAAGGAPDPFGGVAWPPGYRPGQGYTAGGSSGGVVAIPGPGPSDDDEPLGPITNNQWVAMGVAWAVANKKADAGAAEDALRKYVSGIPMTSAESHIRSLVTANLGLPPEPVPPVQIITAPPVNPLPPSQPQLPPPTVPTPPPNLPTVPVTPPAPPKPPAPPFPGRNLRRGSTGPDVAMVQSRLMQLGWGPHLQQYGGADGKFGDGTHHAVVQFQQRNGLAADGIVGPKTWAALWA